MKKIIVYTMLFATLCTWGSCKKCTDPTNPQCGNYNPCYGFHADFYMEEVCTAGSQACGPYWQDYKTDITAGGDIRFTCTNQIADSNMEWHIGSGVYRKNKFVLYFGTAANGAIIPITLIIKHKPNPLCNPNDIGFDTITKTLKIDYNTYFVYGNWQGFFLDHPNDVRTVSIESKRDTFAPWRYYDYFTGCEPYLGIEQCELSTHLNRDAARRGGYFEINGNGTFNLFGDAQTDSLGKNIVIKYYYVDTPLISPSTDKTIIKTFIGKRL